jgi:hypothetical protein
MFHLPDVDIDTLTYQGKKALVTTSLLAFGVAFEKTSRYSAELHEQVADWKDDLTFSLGIWPDGPGMTVKKVGENAKFLGLGFRDPEVKILFKNLDGALLVFTGQIGTHTAAAQHRFMVKGNLTEGMKIARAMDLVQLFLFPKLILDKTFKRPPEMSRERLIAKAKVMATLPSGLALSALR